MKIKRLKKLISAFLLIVLTLTMPVFFSAQVSAAEYDTSLSFDDYVLAHLENFESEIDVSTYAVNNKWNENYIAEEFARIIIDNPQLFYVINSGKVCTVKKNTKTKNGVVISEVYKITDFKYLISKSDYANRKKLFETAAGKALSVVDDSMSDLEKALAIHDYLALNIKYDQSLSKYTAYDALVDRSSVCQGYAMAYVYLMRKLGIDCTMITSEVMNHAWNYVKIGGKWYHVDVTKDDPLFNNKYDMFGRVKHDYFLISDTAIKKLGSKDWNTGGLPKASSTKFDKFFWKDVETGIFKTNDAWYWLDLDTSSPAYNKNYKKLSKEEFNNNFYKMYSRIRSYNPETNKVSTVYKFYSTWFTWGTENKAEKSWVEKSFAGLSLYKGKLYFNTTKEIYSFNPETKKAVLISKPEKLNGYIYGLTMDGKTITYTIKKEAAQKDSLKTLTVK